MTHPDLSLKETLTMYAISMSQHHAGHGYARVDAAFPCVMAHASWLRTVTITSNQKPEPRRPTLISP
jgi:hypothetical protein